MAPIIGRRRYAFFSITAFVSRAIISSSLVGTTQTAILLRRAVIGPALPPMVCRFSASSPTTPSLPSCWQIIRRIGSEFSPIPPVSTTASRGGRMA